MRYIEPFYREVEDEDRFGGVLIPFLGGAVLGGLFAPAKQVPVYVPSYQPYYSYPYSTTNSINNYPYPQNNSMMFPYPNYPRNYLKRF